MTPWSSQYSPVQGAAAAAALVASRVSGRQLSPLAPELRPPDINDAYRVQDLAHGLLRSAGYGRIGGWKIGCTTAVMQEYLSLDAPVEGAMLRSSMWNGRHRFVVSPPRVLGIECEIAVRVRHHMDRRDHPYHAVEAAQAVSVAMAAIEVVEDRYMDHLSLDVLT